MSVVLSGLLNCSYTSLEFIMLNVIVTLFVYNRHIFISGDFNAHSVSSNPTFASRFMIFHLLFSHY